MTERPQISSRKPAENGGPLNVLCADDDEHVALTLKYVFESAGHHVECFGSGHSALTRVLSELEYFDLIVTDHHMPSLSGLQFVEKLREAQYMGRIVVHSSHLSETAVKAYQTLAVERIVKKPASPFELLEAVKGLKHS